MNTEPKINGITLQEHLSALAKAEKERIDERFRLEKEYLRNEFVQLSKATELQAKEYERRLTVLNHAHEEALEVQHTYVTAEKYEERMKSEESAREIALQRVDERFEDYIKRYEQRQREVDILLAAQKGAVEQAERTAQLTQYKANRNIAIVGALLTAIIIAMNLVSQLL